MKERAGIVGLLVILALLATTGPSWANMANPYQEGDQVGEPTGDLRSVAIEHESLVMDLAPLALDSPARVSATYDVRNDGQPHNLTLLFVATALANDQKSGVWLDNQPVASEVTPTALPDSWKPPKTTPGIGSGPDLPYYAGHGKQRGIFFSLLLPAGRHQVRVEYDARASAVATLESPIRYWQLGYVLAPARNWESFGKLDLQVSVPPAWSLVSTLPLKREGDTFRGTFDGVPADTLALTVQAPVPPQPFSFDFTPYAFCVAIGLATVAGIASGRFLRRRSRSSLWALPVAAILAIVLAGLVGTSSLIANPSVVAPPLQQSWIYGYGARGSREAEAALLVLFIIPLGFALTQLSAYFAWKRGST
ncbi:MAG TPA: hypothetical protein VFZ25_19915 [Chloroflexota bacterium]|nr:hypothetical protein [Chloroflexota bacterium]